MKAVEKPTPTSSPNDAHQNDHDRELREQLKLFLSTQPPMSEDQLARTLAAYKRFNGEVTIRVKAADTIVSVNVERFRVDSRVGERLMRMAGAPRIARAPGFAFSRFVGSFLPRSLREAVEAQHADAYSYYLEALAAGNFRGARRVALMMHIWILGSVFASALPLLLGVFKGAASTPKE